MRAVGLDTSYATAGIAKGLEDREILGVTGYRRSLRPASRHDAQEGLL